MPLTPEGIVMAADRQRQSDQEFISRHGLEKFQEKLDKEGMYGYGFEDNQEAKRAGKLVQILTEDYQCKDEPQIKRFMEKYPLRLSYDRRFTYRYWSSSGLGGLQDVFMINKPFPKNDFDQRLKTEGLFFRDIPVYRLAEMTDRELRNPKGWGYWHGQRSTDGYLYVDLSCSLRPKV